MTLAVNDMVIVVEGYFFRGELGVVRAFALHDSSCVGVQLDKVSSPMFSDLGGHCPPHRGFWFLARNVRKIQPLFVLAAEQVVEDSRPV